MNELDKLRPEVRESLERLSDSISDAAYVAPENENGDRTALQAIRTELLRLADENKRMRGIIETLDIEGHRRAEKAETELAALKARIAEQPANPVDRIHEYVQSKEHGGCSECGYPEWEPWHRLALVKVEE